MCASARLPKSLSEIAQRELRARDRARSTPKYERSVMLTRRLVQTAGDLELCVVGLRGLELGPLPYQVVSL